MTVDKWPTGDSDKVALDRPAVFTIRYHNYGEALAPTVFFTDTLPAGTTYVADSSGVAPAISDGKVIWELGPYLGRSLVGI